MLNKRRILWSTFSLAVVVLLTLVVVVARIRSAAQSNPPSATGLASTAKAPDSKERIEMLQITVRPTGFEPAEIEHSNEKFLLAIDNQSGADDLNLELYKDFGEGNARMKLREMGLSLKSLNKREITHLPPGRYVLKEASHPEWTCQITINQR